MKDSMTLKHYVSPKLFWLLVTLVCIAALGVRLYDISIRPFHSDEGVNFHFINSIVRDGFYRYSHQNYHGPAYFYLTYFFTQIVGMNDYGMRGSAILMGWALIPLLFLLLRTESRFFVLSAATLIAASSSQIFHSRYSIHEPLFVWSGALLALAVYLWHRTRDARYHLLSGISLGLLIATKETFIITLFCVFFAFLALGDYRSVLKDLRKQQRSVVLGVFICVCIILLLYSGGLQWPGGLREMLLAVPQWIGRNESDTGHFKPFGYYTQILLGQDALQVLGSIFDRKIDLYKSFLAAAEPQLWFVIVIPLLTFIFFPKRLFLLFRPEHALGRFLIVWTFLSWLVYSAVSYKTPWLIVNITAPACMLLAWILYRLTFTFQAGRWAGYLLLIIATAISLQAAYLFNFQSPYGKGNPFSYVHTHRGMMQLLDQIEEETRVKGKRNVLIGTGHYWPLPYYLREHNGNKGYLVTEDPTKQMDQYDIMILNSSTTWTHPNWVRKYYRLSDVQESYTFFRVQ